MSLINDQSRRHRALAAKTHVLTSHPHLERLIRTVGLQEVPQALSQPIPQAVTKIVVGQMLSGSVANVIYGRVAKSLVDGQHAWQLGDDVLKKCGLSMRKVRTLREFGTLWEEDLASVNNWPFLSYDGLVDSVTKVWGLGRWSASMLAIFHFGNEDVFPMSDGSLVRAMKMIESSQTLNEGKTINPSACKPFRSYLAMYLWAALDKGFFDNKHH